MTDAPALNEPGSFRDRHGRVFYEGDAVYRLLSAEAHEQWQKLCVTRFFQDFTRTGRVIQTREVSRPIDAPWRAVLEHQRIPFVSYPYEWPFGMLKDAALLQLDLLEAALAEDMVLKDASAYNVQWNGVQPVFIDIPSFEALRPGTAWIGYAQFCQLLLFPLMLTAYKGVDFHPWLRGRVDGIDAVDFSRLMSARDLLRPGVLSHVWMHARLREGLAASAERPRFDDLALTRGMVTANARALRRLVGRLAWTRAQSAWSDYATDNSYSQADDAAKKEFVQQVAAERSWSLAWDLGANTGAYSRIAAAHARYVVALDADHLAVERNFQRLRKAGVRNLLPLVMNLADPSPALGWRGLERKSLEQRGRPELTLALALVHHVAITANVPLGDFCDWLAGLGTALVIEFVTREDPMVKLLLRSKDDTYPHYDTPSFEEALQARFQVDRREPLASGTRILYSARPR